MVEEEERRRRKQGTEESWLEPEKLPTEEEKKRMFAMAVVAGVMGAMDRRIPDSGQRGNKGHHGQLFD